MESGVRPTFHLQCPVWAPGDHLVHFCFQARPGAEVASEGAAQGHSDGFVLAGPLELSLAQGLVLQHLPFPPPSRPQACLSALYLLSLEDSEELGNLRCYGLILFRFANGKPTSPKP